MSPSPTKSPLTTNSLLSKSRSPLLLQLKKGSTSFTQSPLQFEDNYFENKLDEPTAKNLRYILSMRKEDPYIEQIINSLFTNDRYITLSKNPKQLIKLIVGDIWNTCHVLKKQCFLPPPNKSKFTLKKTVSYIDHIQRIESEDGIVYEKFGDAKFNQLPFDIQRVLFCLSKNGDDIYEKKRRQYPSKLEYFVAKDNEIFKKIYIKLQRDTCFLLERTISKLQIDLQRSSRSRTTGKNPLSVQQDKLNALIKELKGIKEDDDSVLQCKQVVFAPGEQDYQMRLIHLQDLREKIQEIVASHENIGGGKRTIRRKFVKRVMTTRRRRAKK